MSEARREDPPAGPRGGDGGAALRELVAECLDRLERDGAGALDELCRAHPAQAEALRARIGQLRAMGLVGSGGGTPVPVAEAAFPAQLGEFRLLARLGGGGMGVVYVAEQSRLARRVALKLVRPELLFFPGARERFAREVEALARLQHPGIVPVYAGGEEQGVPFLAMELVRGATLDDVLAELAGRPPASLAGSDLRAAVLAAFRRKEALAQAPRRAAESETGAAASASRASSSAGEAAARLFGGTWAATCLRLARQVAEALQHAHEQGVLHRDVKPSNIMLTPEGRVLLLDFGLATAEGSARLTRSGSHLGSPAYMAPEQVSGEAADARSDVYSLGVTLYEMLTLRCPFAADSLERTRQLVLAGQPPAPRDSNPAVPRDAETVCLLALDRDPARRYPSAAACAADLANVLELRPIAARRPGALLRTRRWAQRHPAAAVGLLAGLLLFVGGPTFFLVQQNRANARIQGALDEATAERDRAEANFQRARQAVNVLLTEVAEEQLLAAPGMQDVRRRLLQSALTFHEEFLAERGDDPEQALQTADSAFQAASILIELGRHDEAQAAATRAADLARTRLAAAPDDPAALDVLGDAMTALARSLAAVGRLDEARARADEGLAARRRLLALRPDDGAAVHDLAETLGNQAYMLLSRDEPRAAAALYGEEIALLEQRLPRATDETTDVRVRSGLVIALCNRSLALGRAGDSSDAVLPDVERALVLAAGFRDPSRLPSVDLQGLANAHLRHAQLLGALGRVPEAEAAFATGLGLIDGHLARQPLAVEARALQVTLQNSLGFLLLQQPGREADARRALQAALSGQRELVRAAPDVPMHRVALGGSLVNHGSTLRTAGDAQAARAAFEEAVALARQVRTEIPDDPEPPKVLFNAAWFLGLTCLDLGDAAAAAAVAESLATELPEARPLRIAAGLLARAADRVEQDGGPEAAARAATWRAQGLDVLRRASEAGWSDVAALDTGKDLASLRPLDGFAEVREAVLRNAEPAH